MNKQELEEKIAALDAQITELQVQRRILAGQWADLNATFAVDDKVVHCQRNYQITAVLPGKFGRLATRYYGRLITKSGALGKTETELYGKLTLIEKGSP